MTAAWKSIGLFLVASTASLPALAAPDISEVLTMTNDVILMSDLAPGGAFTSSGANEDVSHSDGRRANGLQLTSFLGEGGNFFFLHSIYAQGEGFVQMETNLSIAVTNNGTESANLRFDSLITPGFISFQGRPSFDQTVLFNFSVAQFNGPTLEDRVADLYNAQGFLLDRGTINGGPPANDLTVQTSDGRDFTGFTEYRTSDRVAYEWGATPLSLALLPIAPGETHFVRYDTFTTVRMTAGVCETDLGCEGVQVAFGDPRRDGSVGANFAHAGGMFQSLSGQESVRDRLIGRRFDAIDYSMAQIVDVNAPPAAPLPPPGPPTDFTWLPPVDGSLNVVPEPASWLMLISGFGLIGASMRRQRRWRLA